MGGSSGKSATVVADNLFSQDIIEIGAAIGEGTIYGLKDGLKTFYVGGIPFQSETDEFNFQDVCVSFRQGYFDDLPVQYVMGGEGSIMEDTVGISLPGEVVRTFRTPPTHRGRIKQIDLRLLVSALYAGDSKGNNRTSSVILSIKYRKVGDENWRYVTETTASLYSSKARIDTLRQEATKRGLVFDEMSQQDQIDFANEVLTESKIITSSNDLVKTYIPSFSMGGFGLGGLQGMSIGLMAAISQRNAIQQQLAQRAEIIDAYNAGSLRIEGKTTSGYVYEVSIPIFDKEDATHDWEIQITRLSKELTSDEKKYSNKIISVESLTLITDKEKTYRKTAMCQIVAQHTDRFDDIPDFSGEFYGLICEIPSNYNPFEHTYDGVWDGSYKKGWTNNPFWVLRELIMNQDWGLRSIERRINIDNSSFYQLAKYCDERVQTPEGVMLPRYTFNEVVQQQTKIKEYINYVAGAVHSTLREVNGVYYAFMDKPNTPKFFVIPEMIGQTSFQYSSADLESKYNTVKVTFLNAANNYKQDRRTVIDNESINKYGVIPFEFQAIGCTNAAEAIRQAVYTLLTNRDEDIFTTFNIPRLGHLVNVYDHFFIAHKENGWGNHARILSYLDGEINLRDPIYQDSYDVMFHTPFGIEKVQVTAVDPYTLRITSTNTNNLPYLEENSPIVIAGGVYGQPKIFRVIGVMQDDSTGVSGGEVFEFKASSVSPSKFEALDNVYDSSLVNLQYDVSDNIYVREEIPSVPKNVRLRYNDWASYNGQLIYQLDFAADIPAHHYDVVWVDENTGEQRKQRIYGLGAELFPAFSKETTKVSLYITPYTSKEVAGQTKYVQDLVPYTNAESKVPILISTLPNGGNIQVTWSAENSDMFEYKNKYFSYSTPKETKTNIVLEPSTVSYSVPNHGEGEYSFQLVYDRDGSGSKMSSDVWSYTATSSGVYAQPNITYITGSLNNSAGTAAPTDQVYVELEVSATDWQDNTDLNQLTNPFSLRYETEPNSGIFSFLTGKYVVNKLSDTTARIGITTPLPVGSHLQLRLQNQWGATYSAWSEEIIPQDPSYVPPPPPTPIV